MTGWFVNVNVNVNIFLTSTLFEFPDGFRCQPGAHPGWRAICDAPDRYAAFRLWFDPVSMRPVSFDTADLREELWIVSDTGDWTKMPTKTTASPPHLDGVMQIPTLSQATGDTSEIFASPERWWNPSGQIGCALIRLRCFGLRADGP